ncbi:MAG: ABC transporter substrate-binding protein [Cellulomonadaceae bacterium]|jgi:ABC-type glycerol-3-phosphate transport system substrate-binding protein|nr:ABC transporter substrate-binding protein [Cellulomonadaceae bacterium]
MKKRTLHTRMAGAAALVTAGALVLAACSPGGDSAAPASPGTADSPATEGTVTVWHYFSDPQQVALMEKYADLAEAANPGMTVDNVFVPYDQMNSQLISAAGAGSGPDVVIFNGAEAATLALAGALAPLDDFWSDFADANQFPDSVIHTVNDSMYAVQGYVNLLGLWYNQDILDEIGVHPPTTMNQLEDALAKAVEANHGGITLSGLPNSQGEWQGFPWLSAAGFTYDNPTEDALTAGLDRVSNWVDQGWLPQEAVNWDQTVPFQQFAAGNFAFAANGNWQMGTAQADANFTFGVVPLPLGSTGQVYLGGEGAGIGANSAHPELAWAYLTASYLSVEGNLAAASLVGSLPARADAAADDSIASNELLKPFADTITQFGAKYPSAAIPPEAVADVQLRMGQAWSAVIGRQHSPADAARTAISALNNLLG